MTICKDVCKDDFLSHLIDQYINPPLFNIVIYATSITHLEILSAQSVHATGFYFICWWEFNV